MLNFLRSIRPSLIDSGATRKYLLYAIGEIALVVIGILIALQINNWNSERLARSSELNALKELHEEFVANKERFDFILNFKKKTEAEWEAYLATISDFSLDPDKRVIDAPTIGSRDYNISNSALTAVLNSERFENIQNDSLKYLLTHWGNDLTDYQEIETRHRLFVDQELRPYKLSKQIMPDLANAGFDYKNPFLKSYTESQIREIYLSTHMELEYQNMAMINIMWLKLIIQRGDYLTVKFDQIIDLLEEEIQRHQ